MKYELLKGWKILFLLAIMICLSSFNHSFMPCLPLIFCCPWSPILTSDDLSPLGGAVSLPQLLSQALTPSSNLQPEFKPLVCWNGCLLVGAHQGLSSLWSLLLSHLVPLSIAFPLSQLYFPPRLPWLSLWQLHLEWHMCLLLLPTAHLTAEVSGTFKSGKWSSYPCHPNLWWNHISRNLLLSSYSCL